MSYFRMKLLEPGGRYTVRYICEDDETETARIRWGDNDDPREHLIDGQEYEVIGEDVRSWHTKLELAGYEGRRFNSTHFKPVEPDPEAQP